MHLAANFSASGRLKPDIRLAQAVSQFEADLTSQQKAAFRTERSLAIGRAPDSSDVMHLTATIDRCSSNAHKGTRARCVGPRLTNFLQAIQQYVALGDVVIGGSQNLIACGVWALVRTSLLVCVAYSTLQDFPDSFVLHILTICRQSRIILHTWRNSQSSS